MSTAEVWAARSTCSRLHVGAVLSRQGRILSVGYNGRPSGLDPCDHDCDCTGKDHQPLHVSWVVGAGHYSNCRSLAPCDATIHAETNAIAWAARDGIRVEGSTLYVTHQPCLNCAKLIINSGIRMVIFNEPYRDSAGSDLLLLADVGCIRYLELMGTD
jgi:dCMP deaminase